VPSVRERNRQRTREDIQTAAIRLFREREYSGTTVGAIAEEAQVARRTFFRYFDSKEDLALSLEDQDRPVFMALLKASPASDTAPEALCKAMLATISRFDGAEHLAAGERLMASQRLIASDPSLHAAYLRREAAREAEIAQIVASRLGTDSELDYRPRLWAALLVSVTNVALAFLLNSYRPGTPLQAEAVFRDMFVTSGLTGSATRDSQRADVSCPA
jgi:AcrR family transcriptional regulator